MSQRHLPFHSADHIPIFNPEQVLPFQDCFDQAPVGLALTALDGTWVWVNQRCCDLLAAPRDALQGVPDLR